MRITSAGNWECFLGKGKRDAKVHEGRGAQVQLPDNLTSLVTGMDGNMYFTDQCSVWRVTADGTATIIANPQRLEGYCDGMGEDARFAGIGRMVAGDDGFLYIEEGARIRRVALDGSTATIVESNDPDAKGQSLPWSKNIDNKGLWIKADGSLVFSTGIKACPVPPKQLTHMAASIPGYRSVDYLEDESTRTYTLFPIEGNTFTIKVNALAPGAITYRWQRATADAWLDLEDGLGVRGAKTDTLLLEAVSTSLEGVVFACQLESEGQKIHTENFKLHVLPKDVLISQQPQSVSTLPRQTSLPARILVYTGRSGYKESEHFQWQYSSDRGNNWANIQNTDRAWHDTSNPQILDIYYCSPEMNGWQYRCIIDNGHTAPVISESATLTVLWSQLAALSARATVGTGDQTLFMGFVFAGGGKPTLIRGVGPGLAKGDASLVGQVLADPQLTLNELQTVNDVPQFVPVATNENWGGTEELRTQMSALGMGPLDSDSTDAALLTTPSRAVYTAQISGAHNSTGLALAETYDADFADKSKRLTAISVRNQVGTGANILIAGFVLSGNAPKRVLIRGVGPGLVPAVAGTAVLENPLLQVNKYDAQTRQFVIVGSNDNWGGSVELATTMRLAGMGPLEADSKDAVLLMELQPGIYTAQVSGVGDTTGIGLVEIYEAP